MKTEEDETQSKNPTTNSSSDDGGSSITAPLLTDAERNEADHGGDLTESERNETAHGRELNGASFTGAVLNLSTTLIGAGLMALPSTIKLLGVIPGILMIIAMAYLTDKSIEFLLRFSNIANQTSYGGLVYDSFGNLGKIPLQAAIFLSNIGVLIVYLIIIGDVLAGKNKHKGILEEWLGGKYWWSTRIFVILITTLCVLPLTCLKKIGSLRYPSGLSVLFAVIFLLITVAITIEKIYQHGFGKPRLLPSFTAGWSSIVKLFTVVPVLVSAYVCHFNVQRIQNELQDPTDIKPVVRLSLGICSTVYVLTSLAGYLLFGESTSDDFLTNFDQALGISLGLILKDAARVNYVLHLVLMFPVIFYPMRSNFDDFWFPDSASLVTSKLRFYSLTVGLLAAIFLGANFLPSIWDAFQFLGVTVSVCIGFIFPASVVIRNLHNQATYKDKIEASLMIVLAVISIGVTISSAALTHKEQIHTLLF